MSESAALTTLDWHGFPAWRLANDALAVVIVPQLGGKIASLVDQAASYEWLAPPSRPIRQRAYGDTFTDHDLSGWDEMFPTIEACPSPHDAAVQLPDHGEVWALPWQVTASAAGTLTLSVQGRALPYTLTRQAILQADGLQLHYRLHNHGDRPLPYLWAAHPLFNGSPATYITLPESVSSVVNVADHPRLGPPATSLGWPVAYLPDGTTRRLDLVGTAALRDYRKFYAPPQAIVNHATLWHSDIRRGLALRWCSEHVPYLGVWVDEGTYTRSTTLALEPATGYYDSLQRALDNDLVTTLAPGQHAAWWLHVTLTAPGS